MLGWDTGSAIVGLKGWKVAAGNNFEDLAQVDKCWSDNSDWCSCAGFLKDTNVLVKIDSGMTFIRGWKHSENKKQIFLLLPTIKQKWSDAFDNICVIYILVRGMLICMDTKMKQFLDVPLNFRWEKLEQKSVGGYDWSR